MKTNASNFLNEILLTIFLSACAPAYVPNVVNTPLLSNRGEFQAGLYTGTNGFDPQLTYAVTDHIGLMLNGSFANRKPKTSSNYHQHSFLELGAGYYTKLDDIWRFEAFGGAGMGSLQAENYGGLWDAYSSVNSMRIFIQPDIGLTTKVVDFGFGTRFVLVDMYQGTASSTGLFYEPVVTGRLGFNHVKFFVQMGFSAPVNGDVIDFDFEPLIFALGIHARFGNK